MAITDITKPMALDETLQGTNTKMDAVILKLQGIIDALGLDTSVYKPKGNITCAALVPALLIDDNLGNVYNVTDNGTTTSDFVEGAGKPIHVGDNVAIVDIGTGGQSEYKFDLLAGMVDLTNYVQKSATPGLLKNDGTVDTKDYAEKVAGATNGNLAGLNGQGNPTDSGWNGAKDTTNASGNPISIPNLKSNQLAVNPIITFEPIQAGSGTPSPSNIRAISGYDKIEVLSGNKNIVEGKISGYNIASNGTIGADSDYALSYARVRANQQYTITDGASQSVYAFYIEKPKASAVSYNSSRAVTSDHTFTAPINGYVAFRITSSYTTPQLEEGQTATTYQAPVKTTDLSESLGQTVYGATWYPRTGKLGNIYQYYKFDGSSDEGWSMPTSGVFIITLGTSAKLNTIPISNKFLGKNIGGWGDLGDNQCAFHPTTRTTFRVNCTSITTLTDWQSALASNPMQLVYEIDNPTTIQLTPHEISLLKDYAYVSTNGTNIALDYHNGELASLGDVSQLGETINELGESLNKNEAGQTISLSSYTTSSNAYVFPNDGYVNISSRTSTTGYIRFTVIDKNNYEIAPLYMNVTGQYQVQSLFVKRGMKGYFNGASASDYLIYFIPLS